MIQGFMWLTVKEVAETYRFDPEHVRRACRGELEGVKLRTVRLGKAGNWRIHRDSVKALVSEQGA